MKASLDTLLDRLRAAEGDPGTLVLMNFDLAVEHDTRLMRAAEMAAMPHWFDKKAFKGLLPRSWRKTDLLFKELTELPMIEPYSSAAGEPAWNFHEATRLAVRRRLLAEHPIRFRLLSRKTAAVFDCADPEAPDFRLTCEHLYHRLASQDEGGDEDVSRVIRVWRGQGRREPMQLLARFLEELLNFGPGACLSRRSEGLAHLVIAYARENQSPPPVDSFRKAEALFRELVEEDPANARWQRDLSISLNKLGDLLLAQGDQEGALDAYTKSKTIFEQLSVKDPRNSEKQRDLSISLGKLGDLALGQGDLDGALQAFDQSRQIAERLDVSIRAYAEWQHALSISLDKVGDLAVAQDDLALAQRAFTQSRDIRERLAAASDRPRVEWRRDLSVSMERLGDLAVARGDLAGATLAFNECKTIREIVTATAPDNVEWQHDLSISLEKLGDVAVARGDLERARMAYTRSQEIAERLMALDPENAEWQRDLSLSLGKLGDLELAVWHLKGDGEPSEGADDHLETALELFTRSLSIAERLAGLDPENVEWQRDLSISLGKLGDLALAQRDLDEASKAYARSMAIVEQQAGRNSENAQWQRDLSMTLGKLGDLAAAQGDLEGSQQFYMESHSIREHLAMRDPANAQWQRDVWVSCWRLADFCERSGKPADASYWWRRAHGALTGMVARGLHVSPQDQRHLEYLQARVAAAEAV